MKKLFATLLAATMVAGMSVTSLAMEPTSGALNNKSVPVDGTASPTTDDDYTLGAFAFNEDGDKMTAGTSVKGGDKIYYPIISTDEVIRDSDTYSGAEQFLTYASEVEDLRVKIKDEIGGKYIKGAKIVRKNLGFGKGSASKAQFTYTASVAEAKTGQPTLPSGFGIKGGTSFVSGTNGTPAKVTFTAENDDVKTNAPTDVPAGYELAAPADFIDGDGSGTPAKVTFTATKNEVKTNAPTDIPAGYKLATPGTDFTDGSNPTNATLTIEADDTGRQNAPRIDGYTTNLTYAGTNIGSPIGKIYCVEVEIDDYYGTDQTEVEYELELRNRTIQYDTEDDSTGARPATYFNLGEDSKEAPIAGEVQHGIPMFERNGKETRVKFRNNELTLEINEETGAIDLSEAKEAGVNGKVEDVERIFLEGDNFTYEVKASDEGSEFLKVTTEANKKVVVSNQDAKMDFLNFPGEPEFDFTGTLKYTVDDPDVKYYFYEIVDDKPVETKADYNNDDECFELRTRTLGSYVISDKPLDVEDKDDDKADKPVEKEDDKETVSPVNPTNPTNNKKVVGTGAIA